MTVYSTKDARDHFSEVINQAVFAKHRVGLERRGKIVAYVVPVEDVEKWELLEDQEDALEAQKIMADVQAGRESLIPWSRVKEELGL